MSEIRVDTISEKTSANGVSIDSLAIKDGKITNLMNATLSAADLGVGLHIKTGDSGGSANANADELILEGTGSGSGVGMGILAATDGFGYIVFGDSGGNAQGGIQYHNNGDSMRIYTNDSERVRIDSSGKVGISTSSPTTPLTVNGIITHIGGTASSTSDLTTGGLHFHDSSTSDGNIIPITFTPSATANRARAGMGFISQSQDGSAGFAADIAFYTRGAADGSTLGTSDERMRINKSGNVGIGTTSPARTLHVNSADANVASFEGHQGEGLVISSATNGQIDIIGYDDGASAYNKLVIRANGSGNNIEVNTDGSVTMPLQPAFQVRPSSDQSVSPSSWFTVAFGSEIFDQNADFASNTFTAPVTGKYFLTTSIRIDAVDEQASYYWCRIITSNRDVYGSLYDLDGLNADPDYWYLTASALCDMDAGDTATVSFLQNLGTTQVHIDGSATIFSGYLVC